MTAFDRITVRPDQMGGVPCVRGLRIPVATIAGMAAEGMSTAKILEALPSLEPEDVEQATALDKRLTCLHPSQLPGASGPDDADRPADPGVPDEVAAQIRCVYCGFTGAARWEWRGPVFQDKPLGTWSLAGAMMKTTGRFVWWPWAVCRADLGGCGHESKGK